MVGEYGRDRHHRRNGDTHPPRDGLRYAGEVPGHYQHRDVDEERRGDLRPRQGQPKPGFRLHRRLGDRRINTAPPNTLSTTVITDGSFPWASTPQSRVDAFS